MTLRHRALLLAWISAALAACDAPSEDGGAPPASGTGGVLPATGGTPAAGDRPASGTGGTADTPSTGGAGAPTGGTGTPSMSGGGTPSAGGTGTPSTGGGAPVAGGAGEGSGGAPPAGERVLLGQHVLTWYTFQDNTPSNSAMSASGRPLIPYVSVALPFRLLAPFGGSLAYGTRIYVEFLAGRSMPNGVVHTGWVQLDDFCGDNQDDSYCYQSVGGQSYPNVDLWIGDFTQSGLSPSDCSGPAGSGQELTTLHTGSPAEGEWVTDYGGRSIGAGACGDSDAARAEQPSCWYYTPPADTAAYCTYCSPATCAP